MVAPKTLASGLGTLPKILPVGVAAAEGAVAAAATPNGLLAVVAGAKALAEPKMEPDVLLVMDVALLVAVSEPLGVPPAVFRLLNAFEKENLLPGAAAAFVVLTALLAAAANVGAETVAAGVATVAAGAIVVAAVAAVAVVVVVAVVADVLLLLLVVVSAALTLTPPPNKLLLPSPPAPKAGNVLLAL